MAVVHRLKEARQLPHPVGRELVRQAISQCDAVLEGISATHRGLAAVLEHPPAAVGRAPDVRRVIVQAPTAAHLHAMTRPEELRVAQHQRCRQAAFQHQALLAVAVRQHGIEQPRPLDQPRLQAAPVVGRNEQRQRIEVPRPRCRAARAVDVVREAVLVEDPLDTLPACVHLRRTQGADGFDQLPPMRSQLAIRGLHFIEDPWQRLVCVEQRRQRRIGRSRQRLDHGTQGSGSSENQPGTRRRSSVSGNSGWTSSRGSATGPGECPSSEKRASLRLSASNELTGNVS